MYLFLTACLHRASVITYMKIYYVKTHARAAPWFMGLLLGYILAQIKFEGKYRNLKLNKVSTFYSFMTLITQILTVAEKKIDIEIRNGCILFNSRSF